MKFSKSLWRAIDPMFKSLVKHPFNQELAQGSLPMAKFEYYLQQDEHYLQAYTRALALSAAKAPGPFVDDLLRFARDGIFIEKQLHEYFIKTFQLTLSEQQQPACFCYSHFLLSSTSREPFPVAMAALLPCFWVYYKVGLAIKDASVQSNRYQPWIDTYCEKDFETIVTRMIEMTDKAADESSTEIRTKMTEHFVWSTQLELEFCDAAYHLKKWISRIEQE